MRFRAISCATTTYFPSSQIFFAYTKKYVKSAQDWSAISKVLSVQGRKVMPQAYLHQGPFLSWAGFEAVCQDFHIIITPVSSVAGSDSPHPRTLGNHHQTRQHIRQQNRGSSPDRPKPPIASPDASASKTTHDPDSPNRAFSVETLGRGLLSEVQACIAFVSACTHRSMVASFPNGGNSDLIVSGEDAKIGRTSRGSSAEERGNESRTEEDAAYWRVSYVFQHLQLRKWRGDAQLL